MPKNKIVPSISDLLDSSTFTEGKMLLHPEAFDLNQLIGEQIEVFQHIAGRRHIKWDPGNIPQLHADSSRILQVIANFVSNAIKYSPDDTEIILLGRGKKNEQKHLFGSK